MYHNIETYMTQNALIQGELRVTILSRIFFPLKCIYQFEKKAWQFTGEIWAISDFKDPLVCLNYELALEIWAGNQYRMRYQDRGNIEINLLSMLVSGLRYNIIPALFIRWWRAKKKNSSQDISQVE